MSAEAAEPQFKRSLDVLPTVCSQHYLPKELDKPYMALALHDTKLPQYRTRYTTSISNRPVTYWVHVSWLTHSYILHTGKLFNCIVESQSRKTDSCSPGQRILSMLWNLKVSRSGVLAVFWGVTLTLCRWARGDRRFERSFFIGDLENYSVMILRNFQYSTNDVNQRNTLIFNSKVHHIVHTVSLLQIIPVHINPQFISIPLNPFNIIL